MKTYGQMLDGAYEHFHVTTMRQVWGIAIGVFFGWLVVTIKNTVRSVRT